MNTKKPKVYVARHRAPELDQDYNRIIEAFNIEPGYPLPRLKNKKSKKPFVGKRVFRHVRR